MHKVAFDNGGNMYRVMIAEDEYMIALLYKRYIQKKGHEVISIVHSGKEATSKARELRPDIVFMDIAMDNNDDGIVACKTIKKENPNIKVYLVSAYPPDIFNLQLKELEYDGYWDKISFEKELNKIF